MGPRGVAADLRALGLVAFAALLLAGHVSAVSYSVSIYNNAAVTGKSVVESVTTLFSRWKLSALPPRLSTTQPSLADLGTINAYIIYASGSGSYWTTEGLATNAAKLNALVSWVRAGGSLILVNGASTGSSNTFLPLIDAVLGQPSGCVAANYADGVRNYRRFVPPSNFGKLPARVVRYSLGDPLTGLVCSSSGSTGFHIYSSDPTKKLVTTIAAITWGVGKGAVTWTGADIAIDTSSSIALVVAAAVPVQPLPSPPSPPSPSSPPPFRFPPPRVSPSSPPPVVSLSPPPRVSTSPPPPLSPPPRASPPPPPAVSPSPPPRASPPPPPPPASSPPPPPRTSPSPPPPATVNFPPPRVSSPAPQVPPPSRNRASPPPGTVKRSPPPPEDFPPPDYYTPPPEDLSPPPPKRKGTGRH